MFIDFIKLVWKNSGTLLLAFSLAIVVWISAVGASDPNQEFDYPNHLELEIIGKADDLVLVGELPETVSLKLRAPSSVWENLSTENNLIFANLDLTDLDVGIYHLPINVNVSIEPVRVIEISPANINFRLEKLAVVEKVIQTSVVGEPSLGYQLDELTLSEKFVSISGPESVISKIGDVVVLIDVTDSRGNINEEVEILILDDEGTQINGLTLTPSFIGINQIITQAVGYRVVVVTVETIGRQALGYRVTSISAYPQTVTVSSSDPRLVNEMPGFVKTQPLDLTNANDDIEVNLVLVLPEGVVLVSDEQSILVQVGIAAIETSISVNLSIDIINLDSGLTAVTSPLEVDIILSGPVPILDQLTQDDIVVIVDLADLGVGTHLITPTVVTIPERVLIDSINPETIEVEITFSAGGTSNTPAPNP